jgi:hypothetical protein
VGECHVDDAVEQRQSLTLVLRWASNVITLLTLPSPRPLEVAVIVVGLPVTSTHLRC